MGQLITWVVPYKFTQQLPFDVDYSVMNNFLEFYVQLQKFINYKLYSEVSVEYPPTRIDESSEVPTQFDYELALNQQQKIVKLLYSEQDQHMQDISEEFKATEEYE